MNWKFHIGVFFRGLLMILFGAVPVMLIALLLAMVGIRASPYELNINPSVLTVSYGLLIVYFTSRVSSWVNNHVQFGN